MKFTSKGSTSRNGESEEGRVHAAAQRRDRHTGHGVRHLLQERPVRTALRTRWLSRSMDRDRRISGVFMTNHQHNRTDGIWRSLGGKPVGRSVGPGTAGTWRGLDPGDSTCRHSTAWCRSSSRSEPPLCLPVYPAQLSASRRLPRHASCLPTVPITDANLILARQVPASIAPSQHESRDRRLDGSVGLKIGGPNER